MSSTIIYLLLFTSNWYIIDATLSDKRRCADEKCSVPISIVKAYHKYMAPEKGRLSFNSGDELTIYSKEAGTNEDLWGAELNGKRGYVPRHNLREIKILVPTSKLTFLVDTEFVEINVPSKPEPLVIDGTTIYDDINPSSTQRDVPPSTAVPEVNVPNIEITNNGKNNLDKESPHQEVDDSEENDDEVELEEDDDDDDEEENDDDNEEDDPNADDKVLNDKEQVQNFNENKNAETIDSGMTNGSTNKTIDVVTLSSDNLSNVSVESTNDKQSAEKLDNTTSNKQVEPLSSEEHVNNDKLMKDMNEHQEVVTNNAIKKAKESVSSLPGLPDIIDSKEKETLTSAEKADLENPLIGLISLPTLTGGKAISGDVNMADQNSETTSNPGNEKLPEVHPTESSNPDAITQDSQTATPSPSRKLIEKVASYFKLPENNTKEETEKKEVNADKKIEPIEIAVDKLSESNLDQIKNEKLNEEIIPDATVNQLVVDEKVELKIPSSSEITKNEENVDTTIENSSEVTKESIHDAVTTPIPTSDNSSENTTEFPIEKAADVPLPSIEYSSEVTTESSVQEPEKTPLTSQDSEEVTTENPITYSFNPTSDELSLRPNVDEEIQEESRLPDTPVLEELISETPIKDEFESEESWFSSMLNIFSDPKERTPLNEDLPAYTSQEEKADHSLLSQISSQSSCSADDHHCLIASVDEEYVREPIESSFGMFDFLEVNDTILLVALSGLCIIVFLWGYMIIEKMRKEGPLVGKINHLEQKLLILTKENEVLTSKIEDASCSAQEINENVSSELMLELQKELDDANMTRQALEEQIQSLEKELENSTEVGLELNRMLSDVLSSQNGSDTVMANIEQLQKQLVEQQSTINSVNSQLNEKETEIHELQLELEINNKKVVDLQAELEKMMLNFLKVEEEKEVAVSKSDMEINELRTSLAKVKASTGVEIAKSSKDLQESRGELEEIRRKLELKIKEYDLLKEALDSSGTNKDLLDQSVLKAELQQLKQENATLNERLVQDLALVKNLENQAAYVGNENQSLVKRYEEAEKDRLEALTKLEVLSSYFKEKEAELQRQISKHEAMWNEKQGEASSTTERIKFMQDEIQNYKAQVASLQQEIISQEVDLKSQISLLEKKAHENWVAARKAERKIEDARQESAQLRNRLTLRERSLNEDQLQHQQIRNGLQSPLEANGVDHNDSAASPPLIFGAREHLTTSPPLPMLPPGFPLPPPGVGVPFMPPPIPGMPPFMPPPPSMFPGDHRPPPLGRMSSPPINSRYTPDSRAYSPYDRRSPSPTDDEYYDRDSFYNQSSSKRGNERRSGYSTGSNSNESIDKLDREHSKV